MYALIISTNRRNKEQKKDQEKTKKQMQQNQEQKIIKHENTKNHTVSVAPLKLFAAPISLASLYAVARIVCKGQNLLFECLNRPDEFYGFTVIFRGGGGFSLVGRQGLRTYYC